MSYRLIMTGDLHIGRSSSNLPEERSDYARASSAWERIVRLALEERAAAVLLSGDIVDHSNRFWEAVSALESGIRRLSAAGIPVLAVAGNHDFEVMSRLADQFERGQFALIGRGGTWERYSLKDAGRAWLHIDGWSFPQSRVTVSPPASYDLSVDPHVPVLGMVHGDPGAVNSIYAPLDIVRMQSLPPQAWLLGHIHAPRLEKQSGRPWVLMPGSPQAFDPGETGQHGPWVAAVSGMTIAPPEQRPLSTVVYANQTLDISAADDEGALQGLVVAFLRGCADEIAKQSGDALRHISMRLRLTGASKLSGKVSGIAELIAKDYSIPAGNGSLSVEKIQVEVTPAIELVQTAAANDVSGALARLLLDLDNAEPTAETAECIKAVRKALEQTGCDKVFSPLSAPMLTDESVRGILKQQAMALLVHLQGAQS